MQSLHLPESIFATVGWYSPYLKPRCEALNAAIAGDANTCERLLNQLVHGGATWSSSINRAQVMDGARIILSIIPAMIELMLDHPERDFGEILYPVV